MVEAPLEGDIQCFAQVHSLKTHKRHTQRNETWQRAVGVWADGPTIYLVLKFRDDDIEMHEDWEESATARFGLVMILKINSNSWNNLE